jgi:hypothetical protein
MMNDQHENRRSMIGRIGYKKMMMIAGIAVFGATNLQFIEEYGNIDLFQDKAYHRSTEIVLPIPPKRESRHNDASRLKRGSKSKKPKLLIAGAAKDSTLHLGSLKKGMERFLRNFDLVRLVIYENDSEDNTVDILQGWNLTTDPATFAGKVDLISETNITLQFLSEMPPEDVYWKLRPKILAHGRNKLWQQITNISKREDIGYVL